MKTTNTHRTTAQIQADITTAQQERDTLRQQEDALLDTLARGHSDSQGRDGDEAALDQLARTQARISVIGKRLPLLDAEHFEATVAETVAGYRAAYQAHAQARDAYAVAKQHVTAEEARANALVDAARAAAKQREQASATLKDIRDHFIDDAATTSGYGQRLLDAVQAGVQAALAELDPQEATRREKQQYMQRRMAFRSTYNPANGVPFADAWAQHAARQGWALMGEDAERAALEHVTPGQDRSA